MCTGVFLCYIDTWHGMPNPSLPHRSFSLMHTTPNFKCAPRPTQGGFALVIALSLMAFVLLLLLSITTLVQVESRSAQIQMHRMEAEQSALLGLQIALGELQKTAGPDQRVTATAGIFNVSNDPDFKQPHLLGVWKTFKQPNSDTDDIDYAAKKRHEDDNNGHFVQWLSSATVTNQESLAFSAQAPVTPAVELVATGSVTDSTTSGDPSGHVSASTIEIDGTNGSGGSSKYAWHVFDESQKANLTLKDPVTTVNATTATDAERVSALGAAGAPNFSALAQAPQGNALYAPLETLTEEEQEKIVSLSDSALLGGATTFDPQAANAFHVLTTDSKSLLVDVANGGFQKDLSLLFEAATLPAAYADRHIYSELDAPLEPAPTRFDGAEPMPSPDPKWSLLRSHYRLYEDVKIEEDDDEIDAYGIDASKVERDAAAGFFDAQQLLPVVSNAQFIFSLYNSHQTAPFMYLNIQPVITLWNPYNVELRFPKMEMEFHRFPLDIQWWVDDAIRAISSVNYDNEGYVNIANMFNSLSYNGQQDEHKPYRARIHPLVDGDDIVMKPGEYKVFSPTQNINTQANAQYLTGGILKEGWDPTVGGFYTRQLMKDDDGNNVGGTVRRRKNVLLIRRDQEIKLAVRARKVTSNTAVGREMTGFEETNNEEVAAYLKVFQGDGGDIWGRRTEPAAIQEAALDVNRTQVGAIELDLADLAKNLPDIEKETFRTFIPPVSGSSGRMPFLNASLRLKTEQDSDGINGDKPNSSLWLHNGVTNPYFTSGITGDQNEDPKSHQYELTWTAMSSWDDIPGVEYNPTNNRGYGGTGVTSESGVNFAPFLQVPLAPATSIAQFSHAPLNTGGQAPLTTQIVGNSFNSPLLPLGLKSNSGSIGPHLDHSYMANTTLFDGYFLSTATAQTQAIYGTPPRPLTTVLSQFFDQTKPLPNSNFEPVTNISPTVTAADYDTFAQHLYNKGAFNVNSTSKEAWALFLASGTNEALPILDMLTASTTLADAATSSDFAVSRFAPMIGDEEVNTSVVGQDRWLEHRRLTPDQIVTLAEKVVDEVKARGPFQSVAEFVNRQLVNTTATGNSGALQTAIENAALNLNTNFGLDIPISTPKNNDELTGTGTGNTSDGAPSQITQADLLNRLAPSLTVRGDTFRIRAYGETESIGGHTSKAWCEAVVQRQHDFVDDTLAPTGVPAAGSANETFGRRFKIVSFRWLSADEV